MTMYVTIDAAGRAVSMCSVQQTEADIVIEDPCQDMLDTLPSYIYDSSAQQFIKDEAYIPPEPPKSRMDLLEDAMQDLILTTMGGE